MGRLKDAAPIVDSADLPDEIVGDFSDRDRRLREKNLATLREFANTTPAGKRKSVYFTFFAKPVEICGDAAVTSVRFERTRLVGGAAEGTGEFFDIECGLVIPAIGYVLQPFKDAPVDPDRGTIRNDDGRVDRGLYVVGWAKRGPTGVIGTNKPDGVTAAQQILADIPQGEKPGRERLEALLKARNIRWVSVADWHRIDDTETAAAPPGAPRRKFVTIEDMLKLLDEPPVDSIAAGNC